MQPARLADAAGARVCYCLWAIYNCASSRTQIVMKLFSSLEMQMKCLVAMQLIITQWLLTSFADICKFIPVFPIAHIYVFFEFFLQLVVISCWFSH